MSDDDSNKPPEFTSSFFFDEYDNDALVRLALLISGVSVILAVAFSVYLIYKHFVNYTAPNQQRYIVRLLGMVPLYAVCSWLSLRFADAELYLVRDCYEAYVLYQFFSLCASHLDEQGEAAYERIGLTPPQPYPWPFCRLGTFKPGRKFVHSCRMYILQFVFIKPFMAALALVLDSVNYYDDGVFSFSTGYLYVTLINNISVTVSLYYLIMFYMSTKDQLKSLRPVGKFLSVKAVLFFSFWQSVALVLLVQFGVVRRIGSYSPDRIATAAQDFLICLEMLPFALAHHFTFPYTPYEDKTYRVADSLLEPEEALRQRTRHAAVVKGLKDVVKVSDVFDDLQSVLKKNEITDAKGKKL